VFDWFDTAATKGLPFLFLTCSCPTVSSEEHLEIRYGRQTPPCGPKQTNFEYMSDTSQHTDADLNMQENAKG